MIRLLCNCGDRLANTMRINAKALSMKIENTLREENTKIQ